MAIAVSLAVLVVGLACVGRVSIESAERRSTLVGQLRFAATLQDVRTVIVLRRQLALELPRLRPWVTCGSTAPSGWPVWRRDLRRRAALARGAGRPAGAARRRRAAWRSGACGRARRRSCSSAPSRSFLAGVDAVEGMAQDLDHPSLAGSMPVDPGVLQVRHLPVPLR